VKAVNHQTHAAPVSPVAEQARKNQELAFQAFICGHNLRRQLLALDWGRPLASTQRPRILVRDEMWDLALRADAHDVARLKGLVAGLEAKLIINEIRIASRTRPESGPVFRP